MTKEISYDKEYAILFGYWLRKQNIKIIRGSETTEHLLQLFEYENRVNRNRFKQKPNHSKMAKRLRKEGKTIREIANILGYKHPGSISHLLAKQ
jgi:hypothetical protein